MKTFIKIYLILSLFLGASLSVFAQNLAEARKTIDAEQYQKAKSLLVKLTQAQPDKAENFFYLGWAYLLTDQPDSAKIQFSKGVNIDPKSALNFAGLGAAARLTGNDAAVTENFDKSISLARKDITPYIFIGRSYLLPLDPGQPIKPADAAAAVTVLERGRTALPKVNNPDMLVTLGDAYLAELKSNDAYRNYAEALSIDPKSLSANVAQGKLWRMANNWESARQQFQKALAIDPAFGPAYREWAETDYREAKANMKMASQRIKDAVEHYQKYLNLTDRSTESQLRYADFLVNAGDYQTLQQVAASLSKNPGANLRVYRYLGYAAYENKNYAAGLTALKKFMAQAAPKRIIPRDYLYLGRLQVKNSLDSTGILNMEKAAQLDSTFLDVYAEIAGLYYGKSKYEAAGNAYRKFIESSGKGKLNDYFREGMSYYFAYSDQYFKHLNNNETAKPDSTLLLLADSAFSYVQQKTAAKPVADVILYRARANDLKDSDRSHMQALAKPFYEQYINLKGSVETPDERTRKNLSEAYAYLGSYYEFQEQNETLAKDNFEKAKTFDPNNKQANAFLSSKNAPASSK